MSFEFYNFEMIGKPMIGTSLFQPPFKANATLQDEARFVKIINGSTNLYVPDHHLSLSSGDMFIMKCDNFVNIWDENEDASKSQVFVANLSPEFLKEIYDDDIPSIFHQKESKDHKAILSIEPNNAIELFISSMLFYFENKEMMTEELLKLKMRELIMILLNSDQDGSIKLMLKSLFQTKEYDFKEVIHAHLYEDLSIQDLAFFTGLSLSTFKRKFKTVFNTSPNQYIKTKRLMKAENLLRVTDQRISDIAYDCGFNDIGYFSKLFKSEYNISPSDFRKSLTV
ncbi:helix-turn-helix transcriptional regulator [Flammeovirga sp. MY04]|uniref:helix-turn-helix domain-containing protein n=1 Tax=Flammeovirga sp. MY04 TaxID=1191459 RepID=UPI0008063508|nr:helix-turn-helix domain-containing protein [Flammeovirga sp. MY04]ANQ51193.1 helix-turn-helix transcriptional regulator [Flammeovirga sp. MY04]